MTYNYHGSWDAVTGHHSGIAPHALDEGKEQQLNQVKLFELLSVLSDYYQLYLLAISVIKKTINVDIK